MRPAPNGPHSSFARRYFGRSALGGRCHVPHVSSEPSGADRTRTDDFLLAKQVLYQLSYRPMENELLPAKRLQLDIHLPTHSARTAPNWSTFMH